MASARPRRSAKGTNTLPVSHPSPGRHQAAASGAVFLHTGWRSGGTWLWSRCRELPGVHALYEPFHEALGSLRRSDIPRIGPDSWHSRHAETAPYFGEYGKLLGPRGQGVAGYERRFAFERFFLGADREDAALHAYLHGLLTAPEVAGRPSVLKFCRSLGRVAWCERHFPDALHAVVLRHPLTQWTSSQRLLAEERNRYFTVAPVLALARNQDVPGVQQACQALGVRLPALGSADMAYGVETVWRHVKRQDATERYRGFLAYWTLTALAALDSRALLIDPVLLARSDAHRTAVEAALADQLGQAPNLASGYDDVSLTPSAEQAQAQREAAAFAVEQAGGMAPERLGVVLDGLAVPGTPRAPRRAPRPNKPERPVTASRPDGMWQRARIAGLVAFARALQPLRRLHGEMTRRT